MREPIGRQQYRSSFLFALALLPKAKQVGLRTVYAFCRKVDDIADSDAPSVIKLEQLKQWNDALLDADLDAYAPEDSLLSVMARFRLNREDFIALLRGMERDCLEPMVAPKWDDLDHYCDCVASAVGRIIGTILELPDSRSRRLAHVEGLALQYTNILRDLEEDRLRGRLYLPFELLDQVGLGHSSPEEVVSHPEVEGVCRAFAKRTDQYYQETFAELSMLPMRVALVPRLMAARYHYLFMQLKRRGWAHPMQPVKRQRFRAAFHVIRYGAMM